MMDMGYEFGPSDNLDVKFGVYANVDVLQDMENIQLLCHAVHQIQITCSNSIDGNYTQNGVWFLKKTESSELDSWSLFYEGQPVFSIQEGRECNYIVKGLDNSNIQEWVAAFCSYAKQHAKVFGRVAR